MIKISGFAISNGLGAVNKFLKEIQEKGGQIINTQVVAVEYSEWLYITYETGTGQSVDHAKIQELVLQLEKEQIEIEKIWKEVKGGSEKRYVRCLIFNFDSKTYLLDSVGQTLTQINKEDLDKSIFIFNPEENYYAYYGG